MADLPARNIFILVVALVMATETKIQIAVQDQNALADYKSAAPSSLGQLTLLKGGKVYTPEYYGIADVLFGHNQIVAITQSSSVDKLLKESQVPMEVIDVSGLIITPSFVDVHVHVTGGGGEMGPASRVPEAKLDELIDAGISTLVGLLGTDTISRSLDNLLTKLKALATYGLTTYMWIGGYRVPPATLTGDIQRDILIVQEVIGVGETAISDHRSSQPTFDELTKIISDARVAGMISGKAGKAYFHVGQAASKLNLLWEVVNKTPIPITQLYPTHMSSRGQELIDEGMKWIKEGGYLDFTADDVNDTETTNAILQYYSNGIDLSHVTLSSDSYGSAPEFDSKGNLIGYTYGKPNVLLITLRKLVLEHGWPLERALPLVTSNAADYLSFSQKGHLKPGAHADILVLDKNLTVKYMFAQGRKLKTPTWTQQAMFPCL